MHRLALEDSGEGYVLTIDRLSKELSTAGKKMMIDMSDESFFQLFAITFFSFFFAVSFRLFLSLLIYGSTGAKKKKNRGTKSH